MNYMKRKLYTIALLIFFSVSVTVSAQQDVQYTQYMYNMATINPAYAGSNSGISFGFLGRQQWVGIHGAPESITAFIHSPVGKKLGLGLSLIHDKIGPVTETHAYADFSYTLKTSEEYRLAFGLKAGATFQQIGLLNLSQANPNDPSFNQNSNKTHPNFGVGAFFYGDKFYAGLSVPNLLKTLHFDRSNGRVSRAVDAVHGFFTTGYVFDLKNNFKLKPSTLAKYVSYAPLSVDISLNLMWKNKLEFGVSHRLDDSWSGLVNFRVSDSLRIGYAYDHTVSNLSEFNSGSHEFMILFDFLKQIEFVSPRFF